MCLQDHHMYQLHVRFSFYFLKRCAFKGANDDKIKKMQIIFGYSENWIENCKKFCFWKKLHIPKILSITRLLQNMKIRAHLCAQFFRHKHGKNSTWSQKKVFFFLLIHNRTDKTLLKKLNFSLKIHINLKARLKKCFF